MKPTVYVETMIVSYLTARPSRDIVTLAHQHITREWWRSAARRFALVTSEFVRVEAAVDASSVARAPLEALAQLATIEPTAEAEALAERLLNAGAIPRRASRQLGPCPIGTKRLRQPTKARSKLQATFRQLDRGAGLPAGAYLLAACGGSRREPVWRDWRHTRHSPCARHRAHG